MEELVKTDSLGTLFERVEQWSKDKGLDKAAPEKQFLKVIEEVGEVAAAMARNDRPEIVDGLGDTLVTLIILSQQLGVNLGDALFSAYGVIQGRTGKMVDGVFVKSEDL
jgi:NTP pyrophosphatase (non-canonical NTP hydrolase)